MNRNPVQMYRDLNSTIQAMQKRQMKIQKPCSESWSDMTQQEKGKFCAKCEKVVIDLTRESPRDAFQLASQLGAGSCVRVLPQHLDYTYESSTKTPEISFSLKAIAMGAALISMTGLTACAQEKPPVMGKVVMVQDSLDVTPLKPIRKALWYSLHVQYSHGGGAANTEIILRVGDQADTSVTDADGNFSFTLKDKEFSVTINSAYDRIYLTEKDFKDQQATAILSEPIMGEIYIPEE